MGIKVADEVWIAVALLHKENPHRGSFSAKEIVDRVYEEGIFGRLRPGVQVHVYLHCVANKRPNPGNHRMLVEAEDGGRRLYRNGDEFHPYREGGKTKPLEHDIPSEYRYLLDWYENEYNASAER
ncbi:MAG: hypothetical protein ACE5IJ_08030 [Thermoplasmata archaeon]